MLYLIFSVKDVLSGRFFDLKLFENVDCAKRWFKDLVEKSPIGKDLQLYQIGTYNNELGTISSAFDYICNGVDNEK